MSGKKVQKSDRIEEIGFAGAVQARDAGERAESDVDIKEVLKPANMQSCEHSDPSGRELAA
jgi:hypothetical protein